MHRLVFTKSITFVALVLACGLSASLIQAQTTAFTYQGRLTDSSLPANGNYDFQFKLFDAVSAGTQIGSTLAPTNVAVSNGIFTVTLDFGAASFPGANRWLEISVRVAGGGAFTTLAPRQPLTSTPYAIKSLNAAAADSLSAACVNCVTSAQIGSLPANSSNYIQNTNSLQASSNFSISGNGTAGGTLSASTLSGNIVNATTQFNLSANRILSAAGTSNLFAGIGAGTANTGVGNAFFGAGAGNANTSGNSNAAFGTGAGGFNTIGSFNSFFGNSAGIANTTGNGNSFFGQVAGHDNTGGSNNSFFGLSAGFANVSGNGNSFFGKGAGSANNTGSNNTFIGSEAGSFNTLGDHLTLIGSGANVDSGHLFFATAIGAGATVGANNTVVLGRNLDTVQVPGALTVAGTLSGNGSALTNLNAVNITSGTLGTARGGTGLETPGTAGNYLRSNGTFWTSSAIQPADLPTGSANYIQNTNSQQASSNFNISGNGTAGGTLSGNIVNATSQFNLGGSRVLSTAGSANVFAGLLAGAANTTGNGNAFFGYQTGNANTTGDLNTFVGQSAGSNNTTGYYNLFVGANAGNTNTTGLGNTLLGTFTLVGSNDLSNAAAIGYRAKVDANNSLVLGGILGVNGANANTKVGIGTTTPGKRLDVADRIRVRQGDEGTAGIWFFQTTPNNDRAFVGMQDDTHLGLWGNTGATWAFTMDTTTGVVALNNLGSAGATALCRNASNQISTCSSSARYKTGVQTLRGGLDIIQRLRPVTFTWKADQQPDLGLIAEEVAEVEPLLSIHNDRGEIEGVKYAQLNVILINAVKQQQEMIKRQQSELDSLKQLLCADRPQAKVCRPNQATDK